MKGNTKNISILNNQTNIMFPTDIPIESVDFNHNNIVFNFADNQGILTFYCSTVLECKYWFERNDDLIISKIRSNAKFVGLDENFKNYKIKHIVEHGFIKLNEQNEDTYFISLKLNDNNITGLFLRFDRYLSVRRSPFEYIYEKTQGEKIKVFDYAGKIRGNFDNISVGVINKIDFTNDKIIIDLNDDIITFTYTVDCCEISWFEKIKNCMLEYNNTENVSLNDYIDDKYIELDNIVGKSYIGVCYLTNTLEGIAPPLKKNNNDDNEVENKLYKLILNDGFYSLLLLRCKSNGYYSTSLISKIDKKVEKKIV